VIPFESLRQTITAILAEMSSLSFLNALYFLSFSMAKNEVDSEIKSGVMYENQSQ
jgi:hypothetical protein